MDKIEELCGALTDPVVVYPGGWGDDLPQKLRDDILLHRMFQVTKGEELATWPEVCAYMMTASLVAPLSGEWTDIYMYAMTQYKGKAMPADLRIDSLSEYVMGQANRLRASIYHSRVKWRKEKARATKREVKAVAEASKPKQLEIAFEGVR